MSISGANNVTQQGNLAPDLIRLREVTGKVSGSIFFGTLLKTMRESNLRGPYGHGGRGEEVFAAQLHGLWAERLGSSMESGLGDALYGALRPQQMRMSALAGASREAE